MPERPPFECDDCGRHVSSTAFRAQCPDCGGGLRETWTGGARGT